MRIPRVGLGLVVALATTPTWAQEQLTVEDAVSLALSRNERAKISNLNVTSAEAGVARARTAFFPTVIAGGTYTQSPDDVVAAGKNAYSTVATVTISQPILNASAFPLYAQSKRLLDGQVAQTVDDKRQLAFDAAKAFFAALVADDVLAAANKRLDTAKSNFADTQARSQAGLVSTNDVSRAQIDLANAVREVENDKGVSQVAYVTLAFTINAPVSAKLALPTTLLAAGRATIPTIEGLLRVAIAHRPDLTSKRHLAVAAHDFADEPLLRLVPTLSLGATFRVSSDETLVGHGFYNNEFLTATLSWPLFDAGIRYADKRARDAQATIADLTVDALIRSVDAQVRSAAFGLVAAQNALGAAQQARDAAKQSADETAILYKQGLAKAIELVDANDSRFLADVSYASSENSVALAYLGLRQALGLDPIGTTLE